MKRSNLKTLTKATTLLVSAVILVSVQTAMAEHDDGEYRTQTNSAQTNYVYADVVGVDPIIRYVTVSRPERVCEQVEVHSRTGRRSHHGETSGGTIAGGLIGGVIGRQIGGGKGRDAATIAGVLIGSAIGHDNQVKNERNRDRYDDRQVRTREQCQTRYERYDEERIDGYKVTYRYNGETFTTRTSTKPGKKIRLALTIRPVADSNYDSRYANDNDRYQEYDRD